MVDVSSKPPTARRAVAEAIVGVGQDTLSLVIDGAGPKGDVLVVAELAGVMAAKRTAELIPLCHPLPLTDVSVEITPDRTTSALRIRAAAATTAPTGVEMEALTAASVAALTVYDMVKGVERGVTIESIRLIEKTGGASGEWRRPAEAAPRPRARVPSGTRGPRRAG
jgi:cyclic pyranopterin phosphate synthase